MQVTRRSFINGAVSVAAAASVPAAPAVASSPQIPMLAYFVGTPGEFDGQFVRAATPRDAFMQWNEYQGTFDDEDGCERCEEKDCTCDPSYYTQRIKAWDDIDGEPTNADMMRAGIGCICDRCSYEVFGGDGHILGDDVVVCVDCMDLADWAVADPEYHAELLDEILTDEYGPDLRFPEYW